MKLLIFCFVFLSYSVWAQKHDNVWFVGHGYSNSLSTRFDFNPNLVIADSIYRNLPMWRSCVSISDSFGNLQFYSNSIQIFNRNYQLMQNGDNLNPGQIASNNINNGYVIPEGSIIIPHPKQANKYYLFHQSYDQTLANNGFAEYLYYTLIDMNANASLGRVEKKNQIIASDSLCGGQLEAVKHGNGKDWWLLQAIAGTNGFYTFLITGDTIILAQKQYIGNNNRFAGWEGLGQAVFSPNGTKYARYDSRNDLDIFDFDRCTGLLSNSIHIAIQDTADLGMSHNGAAISGNNQYLYVASVADLYQFDLFALDVAASKATVAHYDYFSDILATIFSFMQLAPDNTIYDYGGGTRYMHQIRHPDSTGTNCDVRQHEIFIHHYNGHFIPNFPHYRTPALVGSPCDTLTNIAQIPPQATNIKLYPNPATTTITLESEQPMQRVLVYNALGQQVMSLSAKQQHLVELETSRLENGTYFVSIWIDGKMVHKQFQILR